ncbi:hypothetical protein BDN72DRAFT_906920 [Pluteus cervinus]|uniref:Uncharacterized protein n=1 Tax=Pluteus cervinus TaxID=181527 RepID=A0ACD2ZXJ3_9AGAR|nr:hypothetical protein BDN72DRAFT_906920 [Pluteus cervinus]
MVSVFVEDHRTTPHDKRIFKASFIRVVRSESKGLGHDGVSVYARDVVKELAEHLPLKIQGPLEIGCPHPQEQEFIEYFYQLENTGAPPIDGQCFDPEILSVEPKDALHLHLKTALSMSISQDSSGAPAIPEQPEDLKPLEVARSRARDNRSENRARPYPEKRASVKAEMVAWLQNEVKNKAEWAQFRAAFHRPLQNSEIVFAWQFAYNIHEQYKPTTFISQLPSTSQRPPRVKITKEAIQSALQVGETWLTEAIEAMKIIAIYGSDGTNPNPDVIQELGAVRTPARGRAALLNFLRLAH